MIVVGLFLSLSFIFGLFYLCITTKDPVFIFQPCLLFGVYPSSEPNFIKRSLMEPIFIKVKEISLVTEFLGQ